DRAAAEAGAGEPRAGCAVLAGGPHELVELRTTDLVVVPGAPVRRVEEAAERLEVARPHRRDGLTDPDCLRDDVAEAPIERIGQLRGEFQECLSVVRGDEGSIRRGYSTV